MHKNYQEIDHAPIKYWMINNKVEFLKYLKWILESLETIKPEIITHKKKIGFPDVSMGNIEKEKRKKLWNVNALINSWHKNAKQ